MGYDKNMSRSSNFKTNKIITSFLVVFQRINVNLEMGYLMSEGQERKYVKTPLKSVVIKPH